MSIPFHSISSVPVENHHLHRYTLETIKSWTHPHSHMATCGRLKEELGKYFPFSTAPPLPKETRPLRQTQTCLSQAELQTERQKVLGARYPHSPVQMMKSRFRERRCFKKKKKEESWRDGPVVKSNVRSPTWWLTIVNFRSRGSGALFWPL